jgi:hypothetical protein
VERLGGIRVSVLRNPEASQEKTVEAQHVEERDLDHHRPEQVGPLGEHGAHQQAPVGATGGCQPLRVRVAARAQPLGCRNEVLEGVLLLRQHAGLVPALAVLAAPAEVRHGHDAAPLEPQHQGSGEPRCHADIESAVPGEVHGSVAVERHAARLHDEHRDRRSVPGGERHLARLVALRIDVGFDPLPQRLGAIAEIDPVHARGGDVRGEAVEDLGTIPFGAQPEQAAEPRQRVLAGGTAVALGDAEPRRGLLEVRERQMLPDDGGALEDRVRTGRDQLDQLVE